VIDHLPIDYPSLFPQTTVNDWLKSKTYFPPNEERLYQEKLEIVKDYETKILHKDYEISTNRTKFKFLQNLITETDRELVFAVFEYLTFLEFLNIKVVDQISENGLLEEDIQIEYNDGKTLLLEVKGIFGTSTDAECAQIYKIVNRRKQRVGRFDIFGTYIVNHQRNIEPLKRENPPFKEHQINDALLDGRGLISTWDLFRSYFYITDGIMSKQYVRDALVKSGLIELVPDKLLMVGTVMETFKNGSICIVDIKTTISTNNTVYLLNKGLYSKGIIESIQIDNVTTTSASEGEVGIQLNVSVKKGVVMFLKT
jgi:hypothetical protein